MRKLLPRELSAAKRHPHSVARAYVVERCLHAICALEINRQGELETDLTLAERAELLAVIHLGLEVFDDGS